MDKIINELSLLNDKNINVLINEYNFLKRYSTTERTESIVRILHILRDINASEIKKSAFNERKIDLDIIDKVRKDYNDTVLKESQDGKKEEK